MAKDPNSREGSEFSDNSSLGEEGARAAGPGELPRFTLQVATPQVVPSHCVHFFGSSRYGSHWTLSLNVYARSPPTYKLNDGESPRCRSMCLLPRESNLKEKTKKETKEIAWPVIRTGDGVCRRADGKKNSFCRET